jgi:hypothetical protein
MCFFLIFSRQFFQGLATLMKVTKVFLLLFLVVLSLIALVIARSLHPIPGVTEIKLLVGCQLEYFDTTAQPVSTLVLSCPRVDSIRLWPLPILQPWFEHPILPPGSRLARVNRSR